MLTTVTIIIVLGLLIAFHELGHFLVAKWLGIGVRTFSLGFPPRLVSFKRNKTEYRLCAIPLGGYVQLVGERNEEELPDGFTPEHSFVLRPPWHRMLVVLAGPVFNFVLAWLIYWGLFWAQGISEPLPIIGEITKDSPAAMAGVHPGDRILRIDGTPIPYWQNLSDIVKSSQGKALTFDIARKDATLTLQITPEILGQQNIFGEVVQTPLIGVKPTGEFEAIRLGPFSAATAASKEVWRIIASIGQVIVKLISQVVPFKQVGGPIMIAELVAQQVKHGLANVLLLTAVISVNLGLFNLFPIPVLDGGHLLFLTIETIIRRPVSPRVQEYTTRAGLAMLLLLMLCATFNDLQRHFPWLTF